MENPHYYSIIRAVVANLACLVIHYTLFHEELPYSPDIDGIIIRFVVPESPRYLVAKGLVCAPHL